jgi:hypothetical protein
MLLFSFFPGQATTTVLISPPGMHGGLVKHAYSLTRLVNVYLKLDDKETNVRANIRTIDEPRGDNSFDRLRTFHAVSRMRELTDF